VILRSPDDPKPAHGECDPRNWYSKNLRCIKCLANCPVCGKTCCSYETARRVYTSLDTKAEQKEYAQGLLEAILRLGARAKDASTFSKCTVPGGCGRYVCPECCGACPVKGCSDIQCKVCFHFQSTSVLHDSDRHCSSASPTHGHAATGMNRAFEPKTQLQGQRSELAGNGRHGSLKTVTLLLLIFLSFHFFNI